MTQCLESRTVNDLEDAVFSGAAGILRSIWVGHLRSDITLLTLKAYCTHNN